MKLNNFLLLSEFNDVIMIVLNSNEIYCGSIDSWITNNPDTNFKIVKWYIFDNMIEFQISE